MKIFNYAFNIPKQPKETEALNLRLNDNFYVDLMPLAGSSKGKFADEKGTQGQISKISIFGLLGCIVLVAPVCNATDMFNDQALDGGDFIVTGKKRTNYPEAIALGSPQEKRYKVEEKKNYEEEIDQAVNQRASQLERAFMSLKPIVSKLHEDFTVKGNEAKEKSQPPSELAQLGAFVGSLSIFSSDIDRLLVKLQHPDLKQKSLGILASGAVEGNLQRLLQVLEQRSPIFRNQALSLNMESAHIDYEELGDLLECIKSNTQISVKI